MECYATDGSILYEENVVIDKWREEFFNLYNPKEADGNESQKKFKDFIIKDNEDFQKLDGDDDMAINSSFTPNEVGKVISRSKANKAPGIDGIVHDVLKNENSISLLTNLFNLCFESHKVPDVWLQSLTHPITKSRQNDPRILLNHRGISLLSVISKLHTSALNVRQNRYSENRKCIVNEQNGFREGRCCLDHIFTLHNLLKIRMENNDQTFCAFIDLKKEFDLVDRDFMLYKLRKIGLSGKFYHAVKALYKTSKSSVQIKNVATEWFDVTNGVHQGDSLSPTLFSICLNDLAMEIKDLNVGFPVADMCISLLLYADDIVLFAPDEEKLQSMLNVVDEWCRTWGMEINSKKTQILHVRNYQRPRSTYQFPCGESLLNYTDTYKYLGYMIHEHLCETKNVEIMTACASRSFGRIHSIFKKMGNMGIKSYETLYENLCGPYH